MAWLNCSIALVLVIACSTVHRAQSSADERQLIADLLKDYLLEPRPVMNQSDAVQVQVGLSLLDLAFETENNRLDLIAWPRLVWNDEYLKWDPEDYGGLSEVRMSAEKIWTPDIVLFNAMAPAVDLSNGLARTIVYSTGKVIWIPPLQLSSICPDPKEEDDDDDESKSESESESSNSSEERMRECTLRFGSWTYDGYLIDVGLYEGMSAIDLTDYMGSLEVKEGKAERIVRHYPGFDEPYPLIVFTVKFRTNEY